LGSTSGNNQSTQKLIFLDGMRGLAALYVMIGHARWLLWEGYSEGYLQHPEQYSAFNKLLMYFFSLFKYGHEGVLFFFVLSGFVIHLKYAFNYKRAEPAPFRFGQYFKRRALRIYPPFIFALLLTAVLDMTGKYYNYGIYSAATVYPLINENMRTNSWSLSTLVGNLLFLYKNYVPVYGTNGPAWSLKYEWWFYMLYPLFLLMGRRNILYPSLLMVVLFALSFFPAYWPERLLQDIFSMMLTWWFGVLLAEIYAGRLRWKFSYVSLCMLAIFLVPVLKPVSNVLYDLCSAFLFTGIIAGCLHLSTDSWLIRSLGKLKKLGDFSYTLYIIHFPILIFFSGWIMAHHGGRLPVGFSYVLLGIAITTATAWSVHFLTERPFLSRKPKLQVA
jgi:peptidoglycan/LPS O-acetylase OafA/YrhL